MAEHQAALLLRKQLNGETTVNALPILISFILSHRSEEESCRGVLSWSSK